MLALLMALPSIALASIGANTLPVGGSVTVGSATISTSGSTQTITTGTNAVIGWSGGFDVGSAAHVNFVNSGSNANTNVLNIDNSGNPSEIAGSISGSNVGIWIANQNGIIVDGGATISDPGQTVALMGGQVANDSGFASTGQFSFGSDQASPVTIASGSTVSGATVFVAGSGTVNIGSANLSASSSFAVGGGIAPGALTITPNGGANGFTTSTAYYGVPVSGSVQTQINLEAGSVIASPGIKFDNNGNIQGGGVLKGNTVDLGASGDINNPAGYANTGSYYSNHVTIDPYTSASTVSVNTISAGTNGPQMLNVWVNGNAVFTSEPYISDISINNGVVNSAPNGGSHLIMQASGNTTLTAPAGFTNLQFPGLVIALAGSQGNGQFNTNGTTLTADVPISNEFTTGTAGEPSGVGMGVFLQAGTISGPNGGPLQVGLNGNNESWLNIDGNVLGGISVAEIADQNGSLVGVLADQSLVVHNRAY
ncbi:MAG: filamentous hemagglutinin N-terminal domain-containing protein [Acidiphilium sp.]|nr:filamentous hemagglutinin N-terminal domain-containing protein [Acidiphilium sp.]